MEQISILKDEEKSSVLDSLIELLPFEMHLPGHEFCGAGTDLETRLARGDEGISKLDVACREHDIEYASKTNRRKADQKLADQAFSRMFAGDSEPDGKTAALITACCMISKITFEKCFDRITRVIRRNKKKSKVGVKKSKK